MLFIADEIFAEDDEVDIGYIGSVAIQYMIKWPQSAVSMVFPLNWLRSHSWLFIISTACASASSWLKLIFFKLWALTAYLEGRWSFPTIRYKINVTRML